VLELSVIQATPLVESTVSKHRDINMDPSIKRLPNTGGNSVACSNHGRPTHNSRSISGNSGSSCGNYLVHGVQGGKSYHMTTSMQHGGRVDERPTSNIEFGKSADIS